MKEAAILFFIVGGILMLISLLITIGEIFGFLGGMYFLGIITLLAGFIIYKKSELNEDN